MIAIPVRRHDRILRYFFSAPFAAALTFTGLLFAILGLDQRNGMPRLLPYNWVAILFPPMALACIALGISMMVAELSGR